MDFFLPIAQVQVNILTILILSFAVGFLSGIFGIGGGLVMVPFLFYVFESLNIDTNYIMHLAVGTSFGKKSVKT